jgi:hypothetical protein
VATSGFPSAEPEIKLEAGGQGERPRLANTEQPLRITGQRTPAGVHARLPAQPASFSAAVSITTARQYHPNCNTLMSVPIRNRIARNFVKRTSACNLKVEHTLNFSRPVPEQTVK